MHDYEPIRELIDRVRRRWQALRAFQAIVRAALAAAAIVGVALIAARWTAGVPLAVALVGIVAAVAAIGALAWGVWPLRDAPSDRQVARFIEERESSLDDRLASAVDISVKSSTGTQGPPASPGSPEAPRLAPLVIADAARRAGAVEIDAILPPVTVRRSGFQAAAAAIVFFAVLFTGRQTAKQTVDAVSLTLFPARVTLEVTPGNARVKAGTALNIHARLVGNTAPVVAQLQIANGDAWRGAEMKTDKPGLFGTVVEAVSSSFKYRIVAGAVVSPTYEVTVAHPPRVARIDVDYTYPAGLGLSPRTEKDGGDIYAPAGTDVRIRVFTDKPSANGRLTLTNGRTIELAAVAPSELSAELKVVEDNSYRVALADPDGFANAGDTEYFIRTLEDRAPDVRILKPATDRSVTRLEEVDIEAQAEDDYGVDRLDLVYAVRGGEEHVVPLPIDRRSSTVNGRRTLFLEDLEVQPGDFVSYYVRARDLTRGTRPNEARSDIFFLDVKPYDQEFALAQSQASAGAGGGRGTIDDLVAAQKEIIVATWKLDRRSQIAKGAKPEQDIRAVARAEAELKARVEQASSSFRESTMRDPRRRPQGQRGGRGGPPAPEPLRAGQTLPEEDKMGAAAEAMTRAVAALDDLKTAEARSPEMEALNHLLKAQADVKKREVTQQQAGSGAGSNRSNYDVSNLFDKELQKAQQTNYETRSSAEQRDDPTQSALDKIRELARRQDELLKKQNDLARNREGMSEEELRRELEKLTREQSELRQKAEDLARQMASQQASAQSQQQKQNPGGQQSGQPNQSGQQSSGQSSSGGSSSGNAGERMRDVSEEMRGATNDLRRLDPNQAAARGNRALDKLRDLQRQLESSRPDERRRALGEMQLEARQLAEAQRQIASELGKTAAGDAGKDAVRRLAGEQERLADRTRKLQDALKRQPAGATQQAAAQAARDIERQQLAERAQQSADALRAAADRGQGSQRGNTAAGAQPDEARSQTGAQQDIARAFDKVAETLAGARDDQSRKTTDQLARAQELRDRINKLTNQVDQAARSGQRGGQDRSGSRGRGNSSTAKTPGESGRTGAGQDGGGGGTGADLARLRDEYQRALEETRELMDQLRRDDSSRATTRGGAAGFTFEGQGVTLSSPGTESFKQDFARWEALRVQATQALEQAETSLSQKLQAKDAKDRLSAGVNDKAPPEYQKQVDDYFKAIAAKKKGG